MVNDVVIIIPIYKKELSLEETASLKQCIKILGEYPIIFICPEDLDVSNYQKLMGKTSFSFSRFENANFSSLQNYSKLMLKSDFYSRFMDYKFMLIYQLDAWVFENSLEYWCQQDYDYIGAPWFVGYGSANENSPMMKIAGNGGLSLRKISTIYKLLKLDYIGIDTPYQKQNKQKVVANLLNLPSLMLKYLRLIQNTKSLWEFTEIFEDCIITKYGPKLLKKFKLAPPHVAMKFSFEAQPKRLYKMNNNELPFGCHAFEKYDFEFWKQFIEI